MVVDLKSIVDDEATSWERVQSMRDSFDPRSFESVRAHSREEANRRAEDLIYSVLKAYEDLGLDFNNADPGHAAGHVMRDFVNASILFRTLDVDPTHAFVGHVGGVLHDLGCALVDRYHDPKRAVRHAEVGALLFLDIADHIGADLSDIEKNLIAYSIAAHTHYRGPSKTVTCGDGIERTVSPYTDLDSEGNPLYGVWMARFVDRLDVVGPGHLGRHYLTLVQSHEDHADSGFYLVEFDHTMKPLLRDRETIKAEGGRQTVLEHVRMLADSQNNDSPYGKHDFGAMIPLRDLIRDMSHRIIEAVHHPRELSGDHMKKVNSAWDLFLTRTVEPTENAAVATSYLRSRFEALDETTRSAWSSGFLTAMREYIRWADIKLEHLAQLGITRFDLPSISRDIREVIRPSPEWTESIKGI